MYKRALLCFLLCITMSLISITRVSVIATSDYAAVRSSQNGLRLGISSSRGTIYDCNRVRLTNTVQKIIACVSPTPRAITAISQVLDGEELINVLERLKYGKPVLCEVPQKLDCDGIVCTSVFTDEKKTSRHIIGYTDKDNKGVSGLEKAYDNILYSGESASVFYETDAKGRILEGVEPVLYNPNRALTHGVVTTLDINIQELAENQAVNLERGAIVIAEAKSGKLRALVSRPSFDGNNIELYLESPSSPLFNRAINVYNVGSVFKPLVAGTGLEQGLGNFEYTCTGSCEIIDRFFKCHNRLGHGKLDLCSALAFSCNTFFYNFAFNVGAESLLKTAKNLSFDQSISIADGIRTAKGNLPESETLGNIAHLANYSIGQGEILLSPIAILNLYCAIATNGSYYLPSIIEGTITNGSFTEQKSSAPTKVFEESTVSILREYLKSVLLDGTGKKATPKTVTAAGKTATAQTGKYENGREICSGWFCGFFPAENPEYVAVIFSEDDKKQTLSCGEIFANLADGISALK